MLDICRRAELHAFLVSVRAFAIRVYLDFCYLGSISLCFPVCVCIQSSWSHDRQVSELKYLLKLSESSFFLFSDSYVCLSVSISLSVFLSEMRIQLKDVIFLQGESGIGSSPDHGTKTTALYMSINSGSLGLSLSLSQDPSNVSKTLNKFFEITPSCTRSSDPFYIVS